LPKKHIRTEVGERGGKSDPAGTIGGWDVVANKLGKKGKGGADKEKGILALGTLGTCREKRERYKRAPNILKKKLKTVQAVINWEQEQKGDGGGVSHKGGGGKKHHPISGGRGDQQDGVRRAR